MKLIIVRHGATDYNLRGIIQGHLDIPLNALGLAQAEELGKALAIEKVDRIFSSDLNRARSTTAAILNHRCAPVEYLASLRERHYGEFQGGPASELMRAKQQYRGRSDEFQPDGGESQIDFHKRVKSVWQSIEANIVAETIVFSVHGGVTKSLITLAQNKGMSYRASLVQDNCCINILSGSYSSGFSAELINGVQHLSNPTGLEGL